MIVVADASVLVAELLRQRGRALLSRADLRVVVAEEQWDETEHELRRRLVFIVEQGRLTAEQAHQLWRPSCSSSKARSFRAAWPSLSR